MRPDHLVSPHVLRKVPLEHLVANVAVESLQIGMVAEEVLFQCIRAEESFAADVARVVPDVHVTFEVHLEVGSTRKGRLAVRTLVLPDSIVRGQMLSQLKDRKRFIINTIWQTITYFIRETGRGKCFIDFIAYI